MYRKCGTNVSGFIKKNCKDLSLSKNHVWFTEIRLVLNWLVESLHWRIIRNDCVNYLFTFHVQCVYLPKAELCETLSTFQWKLRIDFDLQCIRMEWNLMIEWFFTKHVGNTMKLPVEWMKFSFDKWSAKCPKFIDNTMISLTAISWYSLYWGQKIDLCVIYCCVHQAINQSSWNDIINERLGA